jgi:hypothetical protein
MCLLQSAVSDGIWLYMKGSQQQHSSLQLSTAAAHLSSNGKHFAMAILLMSSLWLCVATYDHHLALSMTPQLRMQPQSPFRLKEQPAKIYRSAEVAAFTCQVNPGNLNSAAELYAQTLKIQVLPHQKLITVTA